MQPTEVETRSTVTSADTVRKFEDLPCARCENPLGADLRRMMASCGGIIDETQVSPYSGLPIGCCRIVSTSAIRF
jgi:hypothetical protein